MNVSPFFDAVAHRRRVKMRNRRALEAVETLPPYIDSRSDNIAALAPDLARLRPFLKVCP